MFKNDRRVFCDVRNSEMERRDSLKRMLEKMIASDNKSIDSSIERVKEAIRLIEIEHNTDEKLDNK